MDLNTSFCVHHNDKTLNLYCSFCELPVCVLCKTSTHARHVADVKGTEALKKAVAIRRKFLYKLLQRKENTVVPKLKSLILTLTDDLAKLHAGMDESKRKFQTYMKRYKGVLVISEKDWLRDLHLRAEAYYQLFDDKMEFLRAELSIKVESLLNSRNAIETLNDPDLLMSVRSLRANLENVYEESWLPERITAHLKLDTAPMVSPRKMPHESRDQYCRLEFKHEFYKPVYFSRIFDTKIPVPNALLEDKSNKISVCSSDQLFVTFNEYILTYPLDNRRKGKCANNVRCLECVTVRDNILDISCDDQENVFFLTQNGVRCLTWKKKIRKCFRLRENPSCLCVSSSTSSTDLLVGFCDSGKIVKYTNRGICLAVFTNPDPKMQYKPKHLAANLKGEIFFSDETGSITVLDANGIWKGSVSKEIKTSGSFSLLQPYGIACSTQRHLYVIDIKLETNLHVFTEDGDYLQTAVFQHIQGARAVHVDKTGDVWVGFFDGRIRIYRPHLVADDI